MKYRVFTGFTSRNPETGILEHFGQMDLIEAPSKDIVKGYTSYSCSLCGTEYKDYDGSGPPSGNDDDDDKPSLWSKLINGLFGIIGDIFSSIFDGLLDLGLSALSKIKDVVNLFGSFGDSLSILWSWLPSEIVSVFVTGVTVVVFASVIKLFIK